MPSTSWPRLIKIYEKRKNIVFFFQAIRDGVIEAVLDHESGTMQSKDTSDVYSTRRAKITLQHRTKKKKRI